MWAPDYVSTGELAAHVRIGDSADDAVLALAIGTASRAIDQATGRQFGQVDVPAARYYTPRWQRAGTHGAAVLPFASQPRSMVLGQSGAAGWLVEIADLATTTGLAVDVDYGDQTYAASVTDYRLAPINAAAEGRVWTQLVIRPTSSVQPVELVDSVRITARWGWPGIPDAIRQATLLQASRLVSRRDSPFGVAGSPEVGSELRLLAKLDADVMVVVRPFRRTWGAV